MPVGMFSSTIVSSRDVVEILDQRAQAVAVRGDQHAPAAADVGAIVLVPVGQEARDGVLQRLGQRQLVRIEAE